MKNNFIFIICISILFSFNSQDLLFDLTQSKPWELIDENGKKIYEYENEDLDGKYLKIEKNITQDPKLVFDAIKDISQYNIIISNKNIHSSLIHTENDTLYGYQLIKNSIPFTRDRQYIFKMFEVSDNRIDWYILENENNHFDNSSNKEIRTLTLGSGSWLVKYLDDKTILTNKIFVDDEVNLPDILINKIRINNVINIFNDILKYVEEKERNG